MKFALALALVFALFVAIPVSAAPPVIESGTFDIDYMPIVPSPCPGFELREHEVGTWHQISYFDNEGNLLRTQTHYAGTDEWYNATNPDVVLSGPFNGTIEYDALTGQQTLRGLGTRVTVPGYGTVLMQAGHAFPDGRFAGNFTVQDPKDTAQLCSLLAGN